MDDQFTIEHLNEFGKGVVRSAQLELNAPQKKKVYRAKWKGGQLASYQTRVKRYKSNSTGTLSKSLGYEVKEVMGNIIVVFTADEYWYYVNFGRRGILGGGKDDQGHADAKGVKPSIIDEWIRRKPIKMQDFGTDDKGKLYSKGFKRKTQDDLNAMSFMINRKIKTFGIEGNLFWTKSMEIHSKELQEQLGRKIAKDLANSIQKQLTA